MRYSRFPNNRPPSIVNFSIFFHPGHLYSNPPIINFQSFLLTFLSVNSHFHHSPSKRKLKVQHNYYELLKHETHVVSVRYHSGYVYSINICNENDYKTFLHYFFNPVQFPYYSNPPIINNYYNVQPSYYSNPSYYSGLESNSRIGKREMSFRGDNQIARGTKCM